MMNLHWCAHFRPTDILWTGDGPSGPLSIDDSQENAFEISDGTRADYDLALIP